MDPIIAVSIAVGILVLLLALRIPIGFALAMAGFLAIVPIRGLGPAISSVIVNLFSRISVYSLTVIPLFIVIGHLALEAGIAPKAYALAQKWVGRLPGGLAIGTTLTCALFGTVTGSTTAAVAVVGKMALPELLKYKYDKAFAAGCVAASGTVAILIPPSVILIVYGIMAEMHIGKLLIAGFIPGILSSAIYMIMVFIRAKLNPSLAPLRPEEVSWGAKLKALPDLWGMGLIFLTVVGGIYAGIFTPTEAAALGAGIAFLMAVIKSRGKIAQLRVPFWEAAVTTTMVMTIFVGATTFGLFLGLSGATTDLINFVVGLPVSPTIIVVCFLALYIPLGMLLGPMPMVLITVPFIAPAVHALGVDGIWFAILVVKFCEFGGITPPVAIAVYVTKSVAPPEITLGHVFKGSLWYLVMDLLTIGILFAFPILSTWLPSHM